MVMTMRLSSRRQASVQRWPYLVPKCLWQGLASSCVFLKTFAVSPQACSERGRSKLLEKKTSGILVEGSVLGLAKCTRSSLGLARVAKCARCCRSHHPLSGTRKLHIFGQLCVPSRTSSELPCRQGAQGWSGKTHRMSWWPDQQVEWRRASVVLTIRARTHCPKGGQVGFAQVFVLWVSFLLHDLET